jgi:hypothetical protein
MQLPLILSITEALQSLFIISRSPSPESEEVTEAADPIAVPKADLASAAADASSENANATADPDSDPVSEAPGSPDIPAAAGMSEQPQTGKPASFSDEEYAIYLAVAQAKVCGP